MSFFAFDSRENHLKIAENDTFSQTIPAFTFGQLDTLTTHSLGYFPNVRVYQDFSGDVWPISENFWGTLKPDVRSSAHTTTSDLVLRSDNIEASQQTPTVYYRVYKDGDSVNSTAFSTKERQERLIGVFIGSFTATSGGVFTTESFPHGLGEKCFAILRWNDGTEWFDQDLPNWNAARTQNTNAIGHCDATTAYVETFNSYGSNRTIEYELYLYKLENNDDVLFDSRESTFTNFEEGETDIVLSGSINSGSTTSFTGTIPHGEANTMGLLHLNKSDDSTREYTLPLAPLNLKVSTTGGDFDAVIRTEHKTNELEIIVDVNNSTGGTETITNVTWTFRYALFVAKGS